MNTISTEAKGPLLGTILELHVLIPLLLPEHKSAHGAMKHGLQLRVLSTVTIGWRDSTAPTVAGRPAAVRSRRAGTTGKARRIGELTLKLEDLVVYAVNQDEL